MISPLSSSWQQRALGVGLAVLLIAIYFFTFNGYAISRDEWFLFDATESMARTGTLALNYEFDAYPPTSLATARPPDADAEPLQPVLAAPLFWIAEHLPDIGMVHSVWLFNIIITALTAALVYAYGLALGYHTGPALVVALIFGLGTIAWPYSRTFFREPLFTGLALLSAYLILRIRQALSAGKSPLRFLPLFALVFAGALFVKEVTLLLLPALLIEALPPRLGKFRLTRRTALILIELGIVVGLLAVLVLNMDHIFNITPGRYAFTERLRNVRQNLFDAGDGIKGYMFSPARSVWLFSPVLLLGFFGWRRLLQQRRWQELLMPLILLITFTVGYALVRGSDSWFGGRGWGARYLVPVTPFLILWLLPVIDHLLSNGTARWHKAAAGIVVALSTGVQLVAVLVPLDVYDRTLAAQDPPIIPWQEGAWSLRWSPLWVMLRRIGDQISDIAWQHAAGPAWLLPLLSAGLGMTALFWAWFWLRRSHWNHRMFTITVGSLGLLTLFTLFGGLYAIRQDKRYYGDFAPTRDLLAALHPQLQDTDVIVLNDDFYSEFFMNYYKRSQPPVYTLPPSPGERFSQEQAPQTESINPEDLINAGSTVILNDLATRHNRLWLVINQSAFIPWSVRPVEHYLARHYFPVSEIKSSDVARAVLFDLSIAPPATFAAWPEYQADVVFGGSLRLVGLDIPGGAQRTPGDIVPISLLWQAVEPVPQDYTVGLLLMSREEQLVAQRDSYPVNSFEATHTWLPGSLHRDNHGLALPPTLPAGEYDLWAVVYWWQSPADRLPVTGADGTAASDHAVLATIVVTSGVASWP
jgi:hypothetical protein